MRFLFLLAKLENDFLDCQREESGRGDRKVAVGGGSQSKGFFRCSRPWRVQRAPRVNRERAPFLGTQPGSRSPA